MIKIFYQLSHYKKNYFKSIQVQGHADYDFSGKDLVCAGTSAIVNGTINFLKENYAKKCQISVSEAKTTIKCLFPSSKEFQLCLKLFFYQLKNIALSYPQYVAFKQVESVIANGKHS